MTGGHFGVALRRIERLFASGTVVGLSEGQLLERFATRRDEAAFEALVARHGPMVLGICRRILRDPDDVEDAFQATFLVLVRKAGSLRDRDRVGNWLFGVASRVALRARATSSRRRAVEGAAVAVEPSGAPPDGRETWARLHEEVGRLPEKYRTPVVLCYLEGLTHEEAARRLDWPLGTVKGRLARARDLLQRRLTRRGIALASPALVAALAGEGRAVVSPALISSTLKAALAVASARTIATGVVASHVATLMQGVLNAMLWNQLKAGAVALACVGVVAAGAGTWAYHAYGQGGGPPSAEAGPKAGVGRPVPVAKPGGPAFDMGDFEFRSLIRNADETFSKILDVAILEGAPLADLERLIRWSNRELETELTLSGGEADRRDALMAHAIRMKRLHQLTQGLPQSDPDQAAKADLARTQREMAERMVFAEAKGNPNPPSPVPGTPSIVANEPIAPVAGEGAVGFIVRDPADPQKAARVELATRASRVAARDRTPRARLILAKLEEPVVMYFANETPLEDVLKYIKAATRGPNDPPFPIYIDPSGMKDAGTSITAPVSLDLEGVPLKTTLRLLLKQLGLAYVVKDGVLIISSPARIVEEIEESDATPELDAPGPGDAPGTATSPSSEPTPSAAPTPDDKPRDVGMLKSEAVSQRLEKPFKLSLGKESPLSDVIKSIREATRSDDGSTIQVYVDPAVSYLLKGNVEFDLEDIPLRTALSLILSRTNLEWTIQDGLVIISTKQGLQTFGRIASHFSQVFQSFDGLVPDAGRRGGELLAKFDAPITLSFPEATPLTDVMKAIREATKAPDGTTIPIFYGPPVNVHITFRPGLTGVEQRKVDAFPVRIDVKDIPLRTCLALIFSPQPIVQPIEGGMGPELTASLDGRLVDGLLVIGSPEWVRSLSIPWQGVSGGMPPGMKPMGGHGMM